MPHSLGYCDDTICNFNLLIKVTMMIELTRRRKEWLLPAADADVEAAADHDARGNRAPQQQPHHRQLFVRSD